MTPTRMIAAVQLVVLALAVTAAAQTPPPAPSLLEPPAGAPVVQPIALRWAPVVDPDGPIGSYLWQVGTSASFGTIVAAGATNLSGEGIPVPTHDRVSGLPNGTYFWRVKATQMVGGAVGSIESAWSPARSFTVTGLGPAPGTPSFTSPATGSRFHALEFFQITWTDVPGAHHYLLEADDQPGFSHPLTLTTDALQFGTEFGAGWGNEIPNVYYRVRAVSADNVRGLPSATLNVRITNAAPVPPPPTPLAPVGGAAVSVPFTFQWSDTPNPQIAGYDLDVDDEPNFQGTVGVLLVSNISRSDYMLAEALPPGTYFWRVRAVHGAVRGPWSAGASFTVAAPPPAPPGLEVAWIIAEPGSVSGGNPTQARVTLNMPAPAGGALVTIASDLPHAETPPSVLVPAGRTDATVSPITTVPVPGATIGRIRAAYAGRWQQSSLGLFPILWGLGLSAESVVGGASLTGTVTLLNPAPPDGVEVTIVSGDTMLVAPPPSVFIPAGATGATFAIATAPVSVPTRVIVDSGTGFEGYRAPSTWLTLMPAGSPAPPPSLAALTLTTGKVLGGASTTGTVTLTGPAPAGGVVVGLSGSMEGEVVTPPSVTVPAGSLSAGFTLTAPQVNAPRYVLIQGTYGSTGGTQAALLEIDPGPPGPPTLLALGVAPSELIGGQDVRGTVGLVMPAPAGGGAVSVTSDNPTVAQVPASVAIAAGNTANSFTITTSPVATPTTVRIDASAGGVTRSQFINLGPDPNAPPALSSLTLSVSGVTGGTSVPGTVFLNGAAPPGGASVTLATSNQSVARVPPVVTVPAGQGWANFTVTTLAVSSSTQVTITAFYGSSTRSATLTVTPGSSPPSTPGTPTLLSPANDARPAQPVALDWSDVAGAASYDIQVDDSSGFTSPLVRSVTSTASQLTVSGLSPVRHWWRVRARNAAGVAGNWSAARRFTPLAAAPAAGLSALSVSPASVAGGSAAQGTVTLSGEAPSGGAAVALSSSHAAVAGVPASVTVGPGATSASFSVATSTVAASTSVTLTATFNGATRTATVTVTPPPPPAALSSVSVNPASVAGGAAAQGTVTLTAGAPAGGAMVALSASHPGVATVPASVAVSAGATSATFSVATGSVTTSTAVTIAATYNGMQRAVTLTVTPPATGPLPAPSLVGPGDDARFRSGQPIAFDWSDVAGAASYTLQIDHRDSFSAPFILSQTTTGSSFSTSTLPRADMRWRVRAHDAAGNPGAWSAARRIRVE